MFIFIGEKSYKEYDDNDFPMGHIAAKCKMFINAYTDSIITDDDGDGSFDYKDNGEVFVSFINMIKKILEVTAQNRFKKPKKQNTKDLKRVVSWLFRDCKFV